MLRALAKSVQLLKPKRRWAQFSLGTLLLAVTALSIALGVRAAGAERQRRAVAAIGTAGGKARYSSSMNGPSEHSLVPLGRRCLPTGHFDAVRNYFGVVVKVDLTGCELTDTVLARLESLSHLQTLRLEDTRATGTELAHLRGLSTLECLVLTGTHVGDADVAQLRGLTGLKSLQLGGTRVTDDGLAHLQGLTRLEVLDLTGTQVTDAGLEHLQALAGLQWLYLGGTRVTDVGLARLCGFRDLRFLGVFDARVSGAGAAKLREALPNCWIEGP